MKLFCAFRNFHELPQINRFGQTIAGQGVIWAISSGLLFAHGVSLLVPIAIGLITLSPARRRLILSLGSVAMIVSFYLERQQIPLQLSAFNPTYLLAWSKLLVLLVVVIGCLYALYQFARFLPSFPKLIIRHPVLLLHFGTFAGLGLMFTFPPLAVFAEIISLVIWRISYMLQFAKRGGVKDTSFVDHLFYLWPVVEFAGVPFGKGLDYLSKYEAKDSVAHTRAQLAGVKLLVLATIWSFVLYVISGFAYQGYEANLRGLVGFNLGLPTMDEAMRAQSPRLMMAWLTIFFEFFIVVLRFAVIGHVVVGVFRLAGFNIFRNTYKPFLAESIIDFWSRSNYYFKEVMVDFFFYPTFLACRRLNVRLRLFLAVFSAAFIGNLYYHVLFSSPQLATGEIQDVWSLWGARIVYSFMLSIGIWVSMVRQQTARKIRKTASTLRRVRRIVGVWLFYSVAHIWSVYSPGLTWENRWKFSLALIGL